MDDRDHEQARHNFSGEATRGCCAKLFEKLIEIIANRAHLRLEESDPSAARTASILIMRTSLRHGATKLTSRCLLTPCAKFVANFPLTSTGAEASSIAQTRQIAVRTFI